MSAQPTIPGKRWTAAEKRAFRAAMTRGGYKAAQVALPHRSLHALHMMAGKLNLTKQRQNYKPWTEHEEAQVRRAYEGGLEYGALKQLARRLGRNITAVAAYAGALGLTRRCKSRRQWTEAEVALLKRTAHMTLSQASHAFTKAGMPRNRGAIRAGRALHGVGREDLELLSVNDVAALVGLGHVTVRAYIRAGDIKAKVTGGANDQYLCTHANVREFVRRYPTRVDLRRISPEWQLLFIEITAGGLLAGVGEGKAA